MATFTYHGRFSDGKKTQGTVEADKVNDVVLYLREQGIIPVDIELARSKLNLSGMFAMSAFARKASMKELMFFCRQMATLTAAGVSVVSSLRKIAETTQTKFFSGILFSLAEKLVSGQSFSRSLLSYNKVFPSIFIGIIEVGENTGKLVEAFQQLTIYFENEILNRRRLVSTVRYPTIVIVSVIVAIMVMNFFVIPKFALMFGQFNAALPLPTQVIIAMSNFMLQYWFILLVLSIVFVFAVRLALNVPAVHLVWDKYKLSLPVIGNLLKRILLNQFVWSFSLVLRSGVPLIKGINIAASTTGNLYVTQKILLIRDAIEHGENFTRAATLSHLFSPLVLQMIAVGEDSGCLDKMLGEVTHYYAEEIDYDLRRVNDLLQPILLVFIGAMVLLLALGVYLPMWDLIKVAKF
jgi:MSHA biogenesis protein MshG